MYVLTAKYRFKIWLFVTSLGFEEKQALPVICFLEKKEQITSKSALDTQKSMFVLQMKQRAEKRLCFVQCLGLVCLKNQLMKFAWENGIFGCEAIQFGITKQTLQLLGKTTLIMIWPNTILDCICFFFLTLKYPCKMQLETKIGYLVNFDILKSNQNPTLIIFGNLGFFPLKWSAILKSRRYYNPIHFQMSKTGCHNYIPIPSKFACKYSISKLYILVSYYQYSDISFCNNFGMFANINLHYSRYYKTFFLQKKSTRKHTVQLFHTLLSCQFCF